MLHHQVLFWRFKRENGSNIFKCLTFEPCLFLRHSKAGSSEAQFRARHSGHYGDLYKKTERWRHVDLQKRTPVSLKCMEIIILDRKRIYICIS